MLNHSNKPQGEFQEKDFGKYFTYSSCTREECNLPKYFDSGFDKMIHVNDTISYPYRQAKILKTVAYIIVDEDEYGAITEKWSIKNHVLYKET